MAMLICSCDEIKKTSFFTSDEEEENDSALTPEPEHEVLNLVEENVVPESADELFDDFFFNFISDSKYQTSRVHFPLEYKGGDEKVSRDGWAERERFSSQEFYTIMFDREKDYSLMKDTTIRKVSVEWIHLEGEKVEKYNFKRVDSKWILTDAEIVPVSDTPYSGFVAFYRSFVADSTFQRESISPSLKLNTPQVTEDEEELDEESETVLSADAWFEFKNEMPIPTDAIVNIDYGQKTSSPDHKTLLVEGPLNGLYIKYKFAVKDGKWELVEIEN